MFFDMYASYSTLQLFYSPEVSDTEWYCSGIGAMVLNDIDMVL